MKKIFTLFIAVLLCTATQAQHCITTGFDVCSGPAPVTSFTNATQVTGTGAYLSVGSKYKFNNITPGIDAIITIDKMVNAIMSGPGVSNPSIDDDMAENETGVPGSQAALFSPRIASDIVLGCSERSGYVQFTMKFYQHTNGNNMPAEALAVPLINPDFIHFDMDGHPINPGGYYRETGYVKRTATSPVNPVNIASGATLLSGGNLLVTDAEGDWFLTYGASEERHGVSRCSQVAEKSSYTGPQFEISFRFGYDYKPRNNCNQNNSNIGQPTREYGSKIGCFALPNAGPLPVQLTDLAVNYNKGVSTVRWITSQEVNIENYIIERSTDGTNYAAIGYLPSRNMMTVQTYTYADHEVPQSAKIVYYRIRVTERDGLSSLSNIVNVKISNSAINGMLITPNPSTTDAQLRFTAKSGNNATIYIYDASGKMVSQQKTTVQAGNNTITLNNILNLNEGVYVVKLVSENETFSSKLMIWK